MHIEYNINSAFIAAIPNSQPWGDNYSLSDVLQGSMNMGVPNFKRALYLDCKYSRCINVNAYYKEMIDITYKINEFYKKSKSKFGKCTAL